MVIGRRVQGTNRVISPLSFALAARRGSGSYMHGKSHCAARRGPRPAGGSPPPIPLPGGTPRPRQPTLLTFFVGEDGGNVGSRALDTSPHPAYLPKSPRNMLYYSRLDGSLATPV